MKISVVLPTLNEESTIQAALEDLWKHQPDEVMVIRGFGNGSSLSSFKSLSSLRPGGCAGSASCGKI